jgi:hypothetical protein
MRMPKNPKRPRDSQPARQADRGPSVGEAEEIVPVGPPTNQAAAELGRKGGAARAKAMSAAKMRGFQADFIGR